MQPPQIVDRALLRQRQQRSTSRRPPADLFLLDRTIDELVERLSLVQRSFARAATLDDARGRLANRLRACANVGDIVRIEPYESSGDRQGSIVVADVEANPLAPGSIDLIASALSLQFANDLPGAFVQARRALRPDGLFIGALLGGDTLCELRLALAAAETETQGGASPRVMPFADIREVGALLQRAGLQLPVADRDTLTVRYDDMYALMADLRAIGAANPLSARIRSPTQRRVFSHAAAFYRERFGDPDGRIRATFEIVWFSGWAPHASQQKPARRGSADISLADALKQGQSGSEEDGQRGPGQDRRKRQDR